MTDQKFWSFKQNIERGKAISLWYNNRNRRMHQPHWEAYKKRGKSKQNQNDLILIWHRFSKILIQAVIIAMQILTNNNIDFCLGKNVYLGISVVWLCKKSFKIFWYITHRRYNVSTKKSMHWNTFEIMSSFILTLYKKSL